MGLLFLDPLVLLPVSATLVVCWVVWRGSVRSWFGRAGAWTVLIWPLPVILVVLPFIVGPVRALLALALGAAGMTLSETTDASVFAALYLVPLVGLTLWPPRWLLPGWARARLVAPPEGADEPGDAADEPGDAADEPGDAADEPGDTADGAGAIVLPACLGRRGHGSRARWIWQVDAVAGTLTATAEQLSFRPAPPVGTTLPGDLATPTASDRRPALVPSPVAEAEADREGSDTRTGASWGRRYLDADLAAVDRVRIQARRPWARDGLLTLEAQGRDPAHVWVADVRPLRAVAASRSA